MKTDLHKEFYLLIKFQQFLDQDLVNRDPIHKLLVCEAADVKVLIVLS